MEHLPNNAFCLIDSNRGIYIPQQFAKNWGDESTMTREQEQVLLYGPNHDDYWDVWDEVVDTVKFVFDGTTCTLWEDGDLFAVPV
jgi:hypothetical protein